MLCRMIKPRSHGSRPRAVLALFTVLVLCLGLAACGSSKDGSSGKKPDSQPIEGGAKLAALWPLTGKEVTGSTPDRPVIVAKIDNTANSRPQVGLKQADLITEELVEGGMTRLAVFFYETLADVVGPVRSMRASDIGIVKPAHAVIAASGAAPPTLRRLKASGVTFFIEGGPGYTRAGSPRHAPYNLMVKLPTLAKAVEKKAVVPASYLPWGTEADFTGTGAATRVDAVFSRSHTTSWRFQGGKYHNTNSNAAPDGQFVPDSVLVVRVRQGDAGYLDPAGNHVPETIYAGRGDFQLFHGGKVLRGTWSKKNRETPSGWPPRPVR